VVYWITGKKGSRKTTTAYKLASHLRKEDKTALVLDGDEVRQLIPTGFMDEEREEHIMRIAAFAAIAEKQGIAPIIALISPKKEWRQKARKLFKRSIVIYKQGGSLWAGTEYEIPDKEELNA